MFAPVHGWILGTIRRVIAYHGGIRKGESYSWDVEQISVNRRVWLRGIYHDTSFL